MSFDLDYARRLVARAEHDRNYEAPENQVDLVDDFAEALEAIDLLRYKLAEGDYWMARAKAYLESGCCPVCFATDESGHKGDCPWGQAEAERDRLLALVREEIIDGPLFECDSSGLLYSCWARPDLGFRSLDEVIAAWKPRETADVVNHQLTYRCPACGSPSQAVADKVAECVACGRFSVAAEAAGGTK